MQLFSADSNNKEEVYFYNFSWQSCLQTNKIPFQLSASLEVQRQHFPPSWNCRPPVSCCHAMLLPLLARYNVSASSNILSCKLPLFLELVLSIATIQSQSIPYNPCSDVTFLLKATLQKHPADNAASVYCCGPYQNITHSGVPDMCAPMPAVPFYGWDPYWVSPVVASLSTRKST